ncbi:MAG: hypothetical protein HC870_00840 [Rhizobiales bacterium]|nr:hypothetical protein [Hyphomicrobiales bacterium]
MRVVTEPLEVVAQQNVVEVAGPVVVVEVVVVEVVVVVVEDGVVNVRIAPV